MNIEMDGIICRFTYDSHEEKRQFFLGKKVTPLTCYACGTDLNRAYSIIISLLEEANLLSEDYTSFCCLCNFFDKVGLLDLREGFYSWNNEGEGIIKLDFSDENGSYTIRIHDYKKFLFS